jgi:multiple sugar transport system ATP-binding protein
VGLLGDAGVDGAAPSDLAPGGAAEGGRVSALVIAQLAKTYPDGTRAVGGIDLTVGEGELVVLLGPSGCGKTTTLRMIAGLELPTAGHIHLGGREVTRLRPSERNVGMVFQLYALYPHLTVRDNIAFPLRAAGLPRAEVRARVDGIVDQMSLGALVARYPRQLSGGDQQKVSLARAIVRRPAAYLMDEPLGTLDADQRHAMRELIRAEQLASRVTTIYVTHDQEEAMSLADRLVVMDAGEIRQVGTPAEVYDRPADLFVATFVGSPGMNLFPGELATVEGAPDGGAGHATFRSERGSVKLELPGPFPAGRTRATMGIRCEHLREDPAGPIAGRVVTDEYLGSARHVHVDTEVGRLIMRTDASGGFARGAQIRLGLAPAHVVLFDAATEARL